MSCANNLSVADQWAAIHHEDDRDAFIVAVINIRSKDMKVISTCEDCKKPKDQKEVHILAEVNLYAGLPPSPEIYMMLNCTLPLNPPHHWLYTNLPWCEKKNSTMQFALAWDQELHLVNRKGRYSAGSLTHPSNHAEDARRTDRCGISMAGIIPEQEGDTVALQGTIDHLESDLQAERKH